MRNGIKVTAPATVSNLNCGFDVLGVALNVNNDEIIGARSDKPGVELTLVGANARKTPTDPTKNTAGVAVMRLLEYLGLNREVGITMEIKKHIRPGSGLGSSASSACAAVFLANELVGRPLTKRELLPFALLGEHAADQAYHADNVAPCLLGGLILIRDTMRMEVHKLTHPGGLYFTVVFPELRVLTSESRAGLSPNVPLKSMVTQTANIASLVHGLIRTDLDLIARSMTDVVIEPQRASGITAFYEMKDAALDAGAMTFGLSGSGPTVFALCPNEHIAENCGEAIQKVLQEEKVESQVFVSPINEAGTQLC